MKESAEKESTKVHILGVFVYLLLMDHNLGHDILNTVQQI